MGNKNILIVDDHPPTCMGLKILLSEIDDFNIIDINNCYADTIKTLKNSKVDLMLLDNYLPDANGIDVIPEILSISKKTRVAIYSSDVETNLVLSAFKNGASAYISKRTFGTKLVSGIKSIFDEGYYLDNSVGKLLLDKLLKNDFIAESKPALDALTKREQEIIELISKGHNTRRISDELFISRKTVENHRLNIMNKLQIKSSMELYLFANNNINPTLSS